MQKYQITIVLLLLLTACSPKYITKTTKKPPSTKEEKACFSSCNQKYEEGKKLFVKKCQEKVKTCAVETERRVTADFYKYEAQYQQDLLTYKRALVSYKNSMISYRDRLDAYIDEKAKLREEYDNAMDEYYDNKRDYREQLSKYEEWKQEKDENEANKRACHSSPSNKYSCQRVREYEDKYRFTFSSDIPKKPNYEPRRPYKSKSLSKPRKPSEPLMAREPVLFNIIGKEKNKCTSSCIYSLENSCFSSCGGTIKYEQVCVENCD
jgi:hypothetical protein